MKLDWIIHNPKFESDIINPSLAVSPWSGHRNFIYDLLVALELNNIVELGTHFGCSFFAMTQAIKDAELNTHISAVDTWEGDEQAGFYDNSVYEVVVDTAQTYFKNVSFTLKRMLFNDAVNEFFDESLDMIHIDGLHTYEAVRNDFNTWLPKLKKNGIIVFHDIASELGYGSNIFWKELTSSYDKLYLEFTHSWGLGLLFPKGDLYLKRLFSWNIKDKMLYYEFYSKFILKEIMVIDLTKMVMAKEEVISEQTNMIEDRDRLIKSQDIMIIEKDKAIRSEENMIIERDKTIKSQENMIIERDKTIKSQENMIIERDKTIKSQENMIIERDKTINSQENMIIERDKTIKSQENMIIERDKAIKSQGVMIDERDNLIKSLENIINLNK